MPFVNSDLGYRPNYQSAINSALNSINKWLQLTQTKTHW
jgi:hypothetical protein